MQLIIPNGTLFDTNIFLWMLTTCALLILLFYNSAIYFYSRIKSFLYYSIYNFFLVIYVGSKTGFYSLSLVNEAGSHDNWIIQVIYNLAYLQFFRYFLDLKENDISLDKLLKWFFTIALVVSIALHLTLLLTGRVILFAYYFIDVFLPAILILAIYSIYKVLKLNNNLKYYVIFGVSSYIILGVCALYMTEKGMTFFGYVPITAFYIGILSETALFSMGLGHKVRKIANERLIKEREQGRLEKMQLQYEQKIMELNLVSLRNQMNPHFIFNALNAIKSSIISNNKMDAVNYLNKFSKLLREILRKPDNGVYTLEQELDTLKLYLNLENSRLQSKVNFMFDVAEDIDTRAYKIPPLLLQPLAENAIWHGLSSVNDYTKKILVEVFKSDDEKFITIHVEDNGIGLKKAKLINEQKIYLRESLGINLVMDRLMLFSQQLDADGSLAYINLEDENPQKHGTRVVIKLPFK